jgi:putative exporter of polyketide antibiotics
LSSDINDIHKPSSIVLLVISGFSIPLFVGWMHYQTKNNRTALIPNALWRSHVFTSCCILVLLTNALTNCMELYSSLL